MAELLRGNYVFSLKPSPVPLAQPRLDEDASRQELRKNLRQTRDCRVEVIMKDDHTLGGNPRTLSGGWPWQKKKQAIHNCFLHHRIQPT